MNVSGTTVSATGHKGGLGDGLYDRAGARPDLDLDFARTKSLKDRISKEDLITFTRSSGTGYGATYVDENGLVKRSPVNFIFDSEDLSTGTFAIYGPPNFVSAAIQTNAGTSPSGNVSGAFIGQSATGRHSLAIRPSGGNTNSLVADNTRFVMSLFVKRLSGSSNERYVNLETAQYGSWTYTGHSGIFDLVNGTRVSNPSNANITSGIEDVGDGWYRIYFSTTTGASHVGTGFYLNSFDENSNSANQTLTSSQGYLVWGAQFEEGSVPTTYIPTSAQRRGAPRFTHDPETLESKGLLIEQAATNYLKSSSDFNHSLTNQGWSHGSGNTNDNRTSFDNNITNPDGSTGAAYLNTNGWETYAFFDTTSFNNNAGTDTITISCFVKARQGITGTFNIQLYAQQDSAVTPHNNRDLGVALKFDPNANNGDGSIAAGTGNMNANSTITNLAFKKYPNGWFRVSATVTVSASWTHNNVTYNKFLNKARFDIQSTSTGTANIGNENGKHYFWGPQVEVGNVLTTYIPTSGNTVTRSADLASIEGDNFGTYRKNLIQNTSFKPPDTDTIDNWVDGINAQSEPATLLEHYAALAPNGKYEAAKLTALTTAVADFHRIYQGLGAGGVDNNTVYKASVYAKAGNSSIFRLGCWDGSQPSFGECNFTLTGNGSTNIIVASGQARGTSAEIVPVGDGWYRCSLTTNATTVTTGSPSVNLQLLSSINNSTVHTGNNESIYFWGFQLEEGSTLTEFIPSTDKFTNRQSDATFVDGNGLVKVALMNAVSNSEDLTHATYQLSGDNIFTSSGAGVISANAGTSPDGGIAGAIIGEGLSKRYTIGVRPAGGNSSYRLADDTQYVMSVFVKKLSGNSSERYVVLQTQQYSTWSYTGYSGVFDLDTGTRVTDPSSNITSGIEDVGDGWYRIYFVSTTATATNSTGFYINITDGTHSGNTTTQTSSQGLLIWGAQIVKGTEVGDYYKTTGTPSGPPRYNHDPETLTPTGLYLEPAATNLIRYSQDLTTTHWTESNSAIFTPNTITAPDGTLTAGNFNFNDANWGALYTNNSGDLAWLVDPTITSLPTLTTEWKRYTIGTTTVPSNAGSNHIVLYPLYKNNFGSVYQHSVPISPGSTYTYSAWLKEINNEIYYWGPQFELGSVSTSYIPTTQAANRNADIFTSEPTEVLDRANGTKPAFYKKGNKVDNSGISIYSEAKYNASSHTNIANYSRILQLKRDNDLVLGIYKHNNQIQVIGSNPLEAPLFTQRGFNLGSGDLKIGVRNAEDDSRVYLNFNQSLSNRQGSLDVDVHTEKPTDLYIGNNGSSQAFMNGTIKRITFWKTPLPDNKLDKLTA